jgi:hypothetical protein
MGHHYLPQYYLKGFTETDDNILWAYEKGSGNNFSTQIINLAKINKLYSEETEQYLANEIEGPANEVLDKIRNRHLISKADKEYFAKYMAVMWKRVPRAKEDFNKMAPGILDEIGSELKDSLKSIGERRPEKIKLIEERQKEINEILEKYVSAPPEDIWWYSIRPERTPIIVEIMKKMTWSFWECDQTFTFLTCDNPLFYFTGMGVGKKDSEISFPISNHVVLWATWKTNFPNDFIKASSQIVKEMNRRTVHNASRFVYHCKDERWIVPFIKKGHWRLNRIG